MLFVLALLQVPPLVEARPDPAFLPPVDLELTGVRNLIRVPSGDLLVVDHPGNAILRLDSLGRPKAPLARTGSGPGEARGVAALGWTRDTLWVVDGILQRITYFSRDLTLLRSEPYADRCTALPWALMADGRCLVLHQPPLPLSVPDPPRLTFPLTLIRGTSADTIGLWPVPRIRVRYTDAEIHLPQPFADDPLFALSLNGRYFAWIGRRPVSGNSRVTVVLNDLQRRDSSVFEVTYTAQPLRSSSVDSFLSTLGAPARSAPGLLDSVRRRLYRPRHLPAIAQVVMTEDGGIWLREQPPPRTLGTVWRVFTRAGSELYRVRLPEGLRLRLVSGDRLIGFVVDADDVPRLVQYRLTRGP